VVVDVVPPVEDSCDGDCDDCFGDVSSAAGGVESRSMVAGRGSPVSCVLNGGARRLLKEGCRVHSSEVGHLAITLADRAGAPVAFRHQLL
jgi:hypothetical protein